MLVLIGNSCAGKSTIEKILQYKYGYNRIISYTTRQPRENEKRDVDYHYINEEDFGEKLQNGFFAEWTNYNSWFYGIAKGDCVDNAIAVVEPTGFRRLKRIPDLHIISFFIKVDERERVIRMMKRKDNVFESFRRIISDSGQFSGIEDEVTFTIHNPDGEPVESAAWLVDMLFKQYQENAKAKEAN